MEFTGTVFFTLFVFVWLTGLTVFVYRLGAHYSKLTKGITNASLTIKKAEEIDGYLKKLHADGLFHFSKFGIVRYNPFSDTGGSQSFSMGLLDGNINGIVITSLYGRSGNRWFVKEVEKGKGKGVELSKEEESAIGKAQSSRA